MYASTSTLGVDPPLDFPSGVVAAKELGLKAVGIEAEKAYCEIAAKRLEAENAQRRQFPSGNKRSNGCR